VFKDDEEYLILMPSGKTRFVRGALHSKTGRASCVCDWLRDATGRGFATRPWF